MSGERIGAMTDHPVLIPTSKGPVGGMVSEPDGAPRAALLFFQGGGPPARCGVNAVWTRIAHQLAGLEIVVLRFDFACEADSTMVGMDTSRGPAWRSAVDLPITREVSAWFIERTGMEIIVAGSCYGARLGLELAAEEARVNGVFLTAPYLAGVRHGTARRNGAAPAVAVAVDPTASQDAGDRLGAVAVDSSRAILARGAPLWILIGEKDKPHAIELEERIRESGGPAPEVEIAAAVALHPGTDGAAQEVISTRLVDRVAKELRERETVGP